MRSPVFVVPHIVAFLVRSEAVEPPSEPSVHA